MNIPFVHTECPDPSSQIPYIAEAMLNQTGQEFDSYFNVSGILIYDPSLGDNGVVDNAPVVDFVNANRNL